MALVGGFIPPPAELPPPDDEDILAQVTDNTLSGVDLRLGATAPDGMSVPTVWERPQVPTTDVGEGRPERADYSEGLGVQVPASARWDYSSSEANILHNSDIELVVAPGATVAQAGTEIGIGVIRLRTLEAADGVISEFPARAWNGWDSAIPDGHSLGFIGDMREKLGRVIDIARAKINSYDIGFVLCDESRGGTGYVGTVGTQTGRTFWGQALPAGKIPISIALSSKNEFLFIGVHDRATGKGQLLVYWMWAGMDLQDKAQPGHGFPPDFRFAHPGLLNSGTVTGMKLFGTFDLPVKWPTSIDCVCSPNTTGDRIENPEHNAAYLSEWDLSTQDGRDAFFAINGGWISTWGKMCVTSSYESLAVMIDFTPLFAGVRDQYFTTEEKYEETRYADPGPSWWAAYSLSDPMQFPWGVQSKPEWAPVIGLPFAVPTPKDMLMSEGGDAQVACACADGNVRFFNFDGTPNGSIQVGDNPVNISHDKYGGIRAAGTVVTCRASRSVVILSGWGPSATVLFTLQDSVLIDPVAADVQDTHNISMRLITVCDRNGKSIRNYRVSNLSIPQDGRNIAMGPDGLAEVERGGSFDIDGHPFALSDSNVN